MRNLFMKIFSLTVILLFFLYFFINLSQFYTNSSFGPKNDLILIKKQDLFNAIKTHLNIKQSTKYNFLNKYQFFLNCKNKNLSKWNQLKSTNEYKKPASKIFHKIRFTRAVLVYFPIEKTDDFIPELKWLYRSWIEMQKSEPTKWRTDIIIFIQKSVPFLQELNCTYENKRKSDQDEPMCTLIQYTPLINREISIENTTSYDYLLSKINIFDDDSNNLLPFYKLLKENLKKYGYTDSILMAFEGYQYFKSANYDYLIRSDMDVFLTPFFAEWLPNNCNDFYVGRGGYSRQFNKNRLKRIAFNLGLEYADVDNLGSTWYSTPEQFRLISYLTLFGMIYLSKEEFSQPEKQGALGTVLWPYWHYGVLLLYGQNLALNHLIATNQTNVIALYDMLDYPSSGLSGLLDGKIHIHVFHVDDLFSKFAYKDGDYNNMTISNLNLNQVKFYCLKMALESKRTKCGDLYKMLRKESKKI